MSHIPGVYRSILGFTTITMAVAPVNTFNGTNVCLCKTDYTCPSGLGFLADYAVAVYLIFVWVISIYANGVVLVGLARQRSQLVALDILMGNLALSNGVLAMITYPFTIVSLFSHKWQFGKSVCLAYSFLMLFFGLTAIWTLLGIARVFHQAIRTNRNAASKTQQKQQIVWAYRFIGFVVLISWTFSILPLVGVGQYGPAKHGTSCTIDWTVRSTTSTAYITALMLAGFFIPLVGTGALYGAIVNVLFTLNKAYSNPAFATHWNALQRKTLCMSIAVCSCMIVSWTPYAVVSMWETYGDSSTLPVQLEAFSAMMAKSSTAFSPLVHLFFSNKFRHWFKNFLFCICVHDPPIPTTTLIVSAVHDGLMLQQLNDHHGRSGLTVNSHYRMTSQTSNTSLGVMERASPSFLRYIDQVVNEPRIPQRSVSFVCHQEKQNIAVSGV